MTLDEIIREVEEDTSEWSEMSVDPGRFIARVLANKIIKLQQHIEYLERRLKYDSSNTNIPGISTRKP